MLSVKAMEDAMRALRDTGEPPHTVWVPQAFLDECARRGIDAAAYIMALYGAKVEPAPGPMPHE